ncbi:MAG: hypothetical protein HUN04_09775 [Desulfobacter sp.]|nr:MAG: hypothetical protein HUN04_09775 [Desulfobacter sp.]
MIHEFITIHGKFQFEIKQKLFFRPSEKKRKYEIETLFFIPNSLGINERNYTKQMFYSRLKNYIRLRIPDMPGSAPAPNIFMAKVISALDRINEKDSRATRTTYRHAVKIYALMVKKQLRMDVIKGKALPAEELSPQVHETLNKAGLGADLLRTHETTHGHKLDNDSRRVLTYCNEYISMCLAYYLFRLLDLASWNCEDEDHANLREKILSRIQSELDYQKLFGDTSGKATNRDSETLIYKWNILKKYVSSPLHLEIRHKKEGTLLFQLISSLAAALAMIFATAVAFIWQDTYGALSPPLFLALVIGYVFKDRMKEAIRNFLSAKLKRTLSDRQQFVYQNFSTLIGRCRENFYFIEDSQIPKSIMKLRNKTHLVDIENSFRSETIMYYRKEILMKPRAIGQAWDGLIDITRLNISDFLNNMDDPKHTMYVPDKDSYQKLSIDKVYHMNMIRCHRIGNKKICKRFRIVFNRDGIKRIDHIIPNEGSGS